MLDPYVPGRWEYRSLSVNYRTPAEIMAVAAQVLAEFAPNVRAPESLRSNGVQPWSRQVYVEEPRVAIEEFVAAEAELEGTSMVIGPPGVPGTVPASETKGLEYDSVLVVEPERIMAGGRAARPSCTWHSPVPRNDSACCTTNRCPPRWVSWPR